MNRKLKLIGRELRNEADLKFLPGMTILNANGDVDPASLGYDYVLRTTSHLRAKAIEQKFYRVPPADFFTVLVGQGAWMEEIKTNLTFDIAGAFETGIINTAIGPAGLAQVDTGVTPKTIKIATWAKGYQYTVPEVQKALAANNWDVIGGKMNALKRNWDLGLQDLAFLGLKGQETSFPGLLTNSDVTVDTTTLTKNISAMSTTEFQLFVSAVLNEYFENSNRTAMPTTFVMPMGDFLGLGGAASADFPVNDKLDYLEKMFRKLTGNPGFQVKGLAYADKSVNDGRVASGGKNRYALYNNDPETVSMDVPVDFTLTPAGTKNNFQFEGVAAGQFAGCNIYRPREVMYFDHD